MTTFAPVRLRLVQPEWATRVPSPAHDSLTGSGRQAYIASHPDSYLAVTQSPEDVPGAELSDVLSSGRRALDRLVDRGAFSPERAPQYYVYELEQRAAGEVVHRQTGLVGGLAIADLERGALRPHERIHAERAAHMARHLDSVGVQSSPVAVAVRDGRRLRELLAGHGPLLVEATGDDGLTQRIWPIDAPEVTDAITSLMDGLDTYLIDGHHRAAAAVLHRDDRNGRTGRRAPIPADWLLTALFGADELANRAFHRELAGFTLDRMIDGLSGRFAWRELETDEVADRAPDEIAVHGSGRWIAVGIPLDDDPLRKLDSARIDQQLLPTALGLNPERRDLRLTYRPAAEFPTPARVPEPAPDSEEAVLLLARPVPVGVVLDLADEGRVLPPKSTYFEPKVRSGVLLRSVG